LSRLALFLLAATAAAMDGTGLAERLRTISQGIVAAAFQHAWNESVMTAEERKEVVATIKTGLPFVVLYPEDCEKGRYFDLEEKEAETLLTEKGQVRFLDNERNPVDARVVLDRKAKRFVIQWDQRSLSRVLVPGKAVPESLVLDIAHEAIRFAYHVGKIDRNDDSRVFSSKLHIPPADHSIVLPSTAYRYDFHRRSVEAEARLLELIYFIETDLKHHKMVKIALPGYREDVKAARVWIDRKAWKDKENVAQHMDDIERNQIQQRAVFIEQINIGHRPIVRPEKLDRYDFPARAQLLSTYCERIDSMIGWHHKLGASQEAQAYLDKYQRLGTDWFLNFRREKWRMTDEQLAQRFDDYEAMLDGYLRKWRAAYPPIK